MRSRPPITADSQPSDRREGLRATVRAAGFTVFGPLPAFTLGAVAVLVQHDLSFGNIKLGIAVASFFAAAAICSTPAGKLADRLGGARTLRLGLTVATVSLAGMALAAAWWQLVIVLVMGGAAHAALQVGANLLLSRRVAPTSQGMAFGIKQASVPAATMIAGVSVPLLAAQTSWRIVYLAFVVLALLVLLLFAAGARARQRERERPPAPARHQSSYSVGQLRVLAVGLGLSAGAANSLGAFTVTFAVDSGATVSEAGLILALSSGLGLLTRVSLGWAADRSGRAGMGWVVIPMLMGSAAFALLAWTDQHPTTAALVVGTALGFAAGWGWPGLATFIIARNNRHEAAAATGIAQSGVFLGAVAGPLAFGVAQELTSYRLAWSGASAAQLLGGLTIVLVSSGILRRPIEEKT